MMHPHTHTHCGASVTVEGVGGTIGAGKTLALGVWDERDPPSECLSVPVYQSGSR